MRTLKNVVGVLVLSMLFSCNNQNTPAINTDYTNTKNLVGTTWRCSDFSKTKNPSFYSNMNNLEFRFISTTTLELWRHEKAGEMRNENGTPSYSIVGNKITILSTNGIIDGNKLSYTFAESSDVLVLVKQ